MIRSDAIRAWRKPFLTREGDTLPVNTWLIVLAVLALAFLVGRRASPAWLGLLAFGIGALLLLVRPVLGLPALVLASLVLRLDIGTGTDVRLNPASLLVPALLAIWLLSLIVQRRVHLAASPVNRPLILFLGASLLSLAIGRATWDPAVTVRDSFLLVQLAQWAIFAFSAGAFWLSGNLIKDERWLWRLSAVFLLVGGILAILTVLPTGQVVDRFATFALARTPFWITLAAVAAGQLLFNRKLSFFWRAYIVAVLVACLVYAFIEQRQVVSHWVGLMAVFGTLLWLRLRRLRWPIIMLLVGLLAFGTLGSAIYQFAGGQAEWDESGGSRMVLIERVIEVTMRNPVTGLGPAAYRPYTSVKPLSYGRAYWLEPTINSHNNYVDLFAHGGILGLLLFFWFVWEFARLGLSLRKRYSHGFASGYVNGILSLGAGALVIMAFADWILPFVYNIGFPGFQASVLTWLFMGGLLALDHIPGPEPKLATGSV